MADLSGMRDEFWEGFWCVPSSDGGRRVASSRECTTEILRGRATAATLAAQVDELAGAVAELTQRLEMEEIACADRDSEIEDRGLIIENLKAEIAKLRGEP
jgi:hypothetical protein